MKLVILFLALTVFSSYAFKVDHSENKVQAANVLTIYPIGHECEYRTWNYFGQILNTTSKCFEVGMNDYWLLNKKYDINEHGAELCNILQADDDYKNGNFSIVGFSYGGMLARYVIEYCEFPSPVRNLVTFGSPLNGVSALSNYGRDSMVGSVLDWMIDKLIDWDI